ncbi:hypothetical protein QR680_008543 [Steinernema hermaphroditum]|uniref:Serine/threonine-protein kinase RIO1 n=1 Tax=Steinernema hermaphroditum TaxID=289476 RepID=A0AA39IJ87_9BILA|nr:hypothetical protein QR680_008543 [Steinernema hermaphroditum]
MKDEAEEQMLPVFGAPFGNGPPNRSVHLMWSIDGDGCDDKEQRLGGFFVKGGGDIGVLGSAEDYVLLDLHQTCQKSQRRVIKMVDIQPVAVAPPSTEESSDGDKWKPVEEADDWSDFEDEVGDDYFDETGDFTKKLNAARLHQIGPNNQAVRHANESSSSASKSVPAGFLQIHDYRVQREQDSLADKKRNRVKDRADRATVEQVLDPRTRLILFRLLQRGSLESVEGCISTGKEANVYHATNGKQSLAVKIYKTSILTFKDRDRYVTGEFRYRNGYCKHNPRKMVATWAEKEMRNLLRMHQAGMNVPKPHFLKGHVLIMDFIGRDGWPAPLLKNVTNFTEELVEKLYLETIHGMRTLFRDCRLVHAGILAHQRLSNDVLA